MGLRMDWNSFQGQTCGRYARFTIYWLMKGTQEPEVSDLVFKQALSPPKMWVHPT